MKSEQILEQITTILYEASRLYIKASEIEVEMQSLNPLSDTDDKKEDGETILPGQMP